MRVLTDHKTGARFDDWVDIDTDEDAYLGAWTQVCGYCVRKLNLIKKNLSPTSDGPGCGVEGCDKTAEYYYDFDPEVTE